MIPSLTQHPTARARSVAVAVTAAALALPATAVSTADAAPQPTRQAATPTAAAHSSDTKAKPRFPGHHPGKIYLGMSCGVMCHQKVPQLNRSFGLQRWYKKWGNWNGVAEAIRENHRAHRMPWVSIEPPQGGAPTGWRDVARGRYDRDIRDLARALKSVDNKPAFIAFDHEPSNKGAAYQGKWWAHGYNHFVDVLRKAHALRHIAVPPIMADWMFNKYNHEDNPKDWLLPGVLNRAPFLAVDVYQNDSGKTYGSRLPRIARWLGRNGHPRMMLGIGETGATNFYRNTTAVSWLNRSLRWAAHHPGRVAAVSYFNSTAYSRDGAYWPLDETSNKMQTYRKWLSKPVFLQRTR